MSPLGPGFTFGFLGDGSQDNSTSDGVMTEAVSFAGSGIVFNNTYTSNVTQAYKNAILAAEQDIASHWVNTITINFKFDAEAEGQNGTLASNSFGLVEGISYTALKNALAAHDTTSADAQEAVASLPATDPSGGVGWSLPVAYARFLGLTTITPATDDSVTLNTSYAWTYGQDVIATVEHEITEGGMGRIGALGKNTDTAGHVLWSTMDLFRYTAAGVRDFTDGQDGKATFFSIDGSQEFLQYNNQYSGATRVNNGDTADFIVSDVFGVGSPGDSRPLSTTDIKMMNVLGWTPATTTSTPDNWHVVGAGDVNGDHDSDVLWQSDGGEAGIWLMNGATPVFMTAPTAFTNFGSAWQIKGSGDFNGDHDADILWQNDSGQVGVWLMNGATPVAQNNVGANFGPSWHVVGAADFDGDGKSDILWQNVNGPAGIWLMNATAPVAQTTVGENPGASWHVIGAGDFDGDGRADILWQNDSGQAGLWLMSGVTVLAQTPIGQNPGPAWHVKAVGDFNGDGHADILWQNDNGQAGVWLMNGTNVLAEANVGGNPGPSWHVIAAADFNGDSRADILWQNDNGQAGVWLMNGTTPILQTNVGFNPDTVAHGGAAMADLLLH